MVSSPPFSEPAQLLHGLFPFLVVGTIGFLVDGALLTALVKAGGWSPFGARVISFVVAASVTWYLNRTWSFSRQVSRRQRDEYVAYFAVQGLSAVINVGVYSVCIVSSPDMAETPILALAVASVVAMGFNFFGMKFFVFTGQVSPVSDA